MVLNRLHWGHFLGGTSVAFLPISLYAPKGLALLFIILAVAALSFKLFHKSIKATPMLGRGPLVVVLALPVLGAISAVWSLSPTTTLKTALILGTTFYVGLLMVKLSSSLEGCERRFTEKSIIAGGLIGYSLLGIEQVSNAGITRLLQEMAGRHITERLDYTLPFNQGMTVAALYLWPFAVILIRKLPFHASIPILALCAGSIFFSEAEAPGFALIVGAIVLILSRTMKTIMPRVLVFTVVIGTLFAPAILNLLPDPRTETPSLTKYSNSTLHRFIIWHTAQDHILEKPLIGSGLNSTRFLYSKQDRVIYKVTNPETGRSWGVFSEPIPLHPHNAILQVWMELGLLGAVCLTVFLVTILNWLRRLPVSRWEAASCFGFFTCALAIESISYGAWQGWWISGMWLSSALVVSALSLQGNQAS